MRTKVFKSNIAFGVLVAVVLMFGVQGVADALTFGTSRSGDFQVVLPGDEFDITFRPDLNGSVDVNDLMTPRLPRHRKASTTDIANAPRTDNDPDPITSNFSVTVDAGYDPGDTHYYTVTTKENMARTAPGATGTVVRTINTRHWVTEAEAYYYNAEQVTIAVTGGATLKKVGRYDAPSNGILMETGTDGSKLLDSSMTLTFTAPSPAAEQTITITDTTTDDYPTGTVVRPLTFTVYVVGPLNSTGITAVASGKDGVERVSDQQDTKIDEDFTFSPFENEPVYYTVEGSGRLYVSDPSDPTRRTSSTNNLYTSSSADVYLDANGGSSKVTAYIAGSSDTKTVLYIFSGGTLSALPQIEIQSGNSQTGAPGGRLDDYFEVRVTDGRRRPVSGLPVTFTALDPGNPTTASEFIPVPGTRIYAAAPTAESIDAGTPAITEATATTPAAAAEHHVQTDRNGVAKIYYQLSSNTSEDDRPVPHTVTATAYGVGLSTTLTATASTTARAGIANLEIVSGNNQRADKAGFLTNDLVVIVRSLAGHRIRNAIIQFRTTTGTLVPAIGIEQPTLEELGFTSGNEARNPKRGQQIYVKTGPNGETGVTYNVGQLVAARDVVAEVRHEATATTQYDFAIDRVVFNVNGGGAPREPSGAPAPTNTIALSLSSTTGEPGDEITVTVTSDPSVRFVTLSSADFANSLFSPQSDTTPFTSTLTLPDTDGDYDISAASAGLTADTATVTVETGILGTISITAIGQASDGAQSFSIRVVDTDGDRISSALTVRLSGSGFTPQNVPTTNGVGNARLTLPTTAALYTLTASAEGYTSGTTQIRVAGTPQDQADEAEEEEEEVVTVGDPDSISIGGSATRTGIANTQLDAPLLVRVLDDDGDAVAETRVIFRVRTGQGRLSERGNGRAIALQTDNSGYARAPYTPISASSTVEAEASGVTRTVTFTITASGGAATPTSTTPRDTDTGSDTISPVVHTAAAKRPPMLWVDNGAIYALVDTDVQRFAPTVDNALSLAIGGDTVYWTEKTGDSAGTINSANLDGTGIKELKAIMAVPMGITVDTTANLLYWTNSRGRIQSLNADGSGRVENVLQNLTSPLDIGLAGGNVYWTHSNGGIGFASLRGQKQVRNISNGADAAGSLVIGGGKVYWTEETGENGGRIKSANLNGSGITDVASIFAVPIGIGLDSSRGKLFWTNSRGRIQSSDLEGNGVSNVVDGLGSPGDMVLSNSITAPAATTTTTTTTADNAKYDVNGDGTVDNMDAGLVSEAMGTSNAKYDVNGDGTVNFLDLLLVFDNRDEGAASAPTVLGMQLSAVQVDVLQEQIDLLIATGDRSPAAMRTLIYLQQLIATARPEQTQLLANYPNPFNPETWIPYELATDTTVTLTIYNTHGAVIRTLQLGHQRTGYYVGRDRAAYWDGRNALGEHVASGIYFYQLETDTLSLMRKMVILK